MNRRVMAAGCAAVMTSLLPASPAFADQDRVRLLGATTVPHALEFEGTTVGGLSGIDRDSRTGEFVLISDDRSQQQPSRFYTARLNPRTGAPELTGTRPFLRPDGTPHPPPEAGDGTTVDPEEIRFDPRSDELWWTSEGARAEQVIDPAVRVAAPDGSFRSDLELPENLRMAEGTGPRHNEALEALTFAAGGELVVHATEGPLMQDGASPTVDHGALVRVTAQDRSGAVVAQHAYPMDPVFAESPGGGFSNNGVVSVLAADEHDPYRYLVMERSFVTGVGNSVRIYEVDARGATDVRDLDSLNGADVTPVRKELLVDLGDLDLGEHGPVDNVEGMTWGPRLPGGEQSLVLVSDDNFSAEQKTQLIALGVR